MAITVENARELQRRSLQARRENSANLQQNGRKYTTIASDRLGVCMQNTSLSGGPFQIETLNRVRKQIALCQNNIDVSMAKRESKASKEWTDALSRLNEIERQLAGRPMPGSLKPQQPRRNSASSEPIPEPIQATPMPVAPVAPAPAKTPQARSNCGVPPTMYSVPLFAGDPQKPQSSEVA